MKHATAILVSSASIIVFLSSACRNRPSDGSSDGSLTPEQQAAVDAVVEQLTATGKALTGFVEGFESLDEPEDESFGECPTITATHEDGVTTVTIDFSEDVCNVDYLGDNLVSGNIRLTLDASEQSLTVVYENFQIDDESIEGELTLQFTRDENFRRILSGDVSLSNSTVGTVQGSIEIRYDLVNDSMTIVSGELALTDLNDETLSVTLDNLVIRPVANSGFTPESGTVTFEIPNDGPGPETITIVIEFSDDSPADGTVEVAVGDAPPVVYNFAATVPVGEECADNVIACKSRRR